MNVSTALRPTNAREASTLMQQHLLFSAVSNVLVLVHSERPPSDAEWQPCMDETKKRVKSGTLAGILVVTAGGGPTSVQRMMIGDIDGFQKLPTAIVADSTIARGIVTAISWFGKDIRSFQPAALDGAFQYLRVEARTRQWLLREVASLRARLAGTTLNALEGQEKSGALPAVTEMAEYVATVPLDQLRGAVRSR
jgi:hypothetical protein